MPDGPGGGAGLNDTSGARISCNTDGTITLAPAASQLVTVTGSRGANAALANLLTTLAAMGLITDGTTV